MAVQTTNPPGKLAVKKIQTEVRAALGRVHETGCKNCGRPLRFSEVGFKQVPSCILCDAADRWPRFK